MADYRSEIQHIAEEIAEKQFGRYFYDLTPRLQAFIVSVAARDWADKQPAGEGEREKEETHGKRD